MSRGQICSPRAQPAKTYIRYPEIHVSIPRICVTTGSLRTSSSPHRFYPTSPLPSPFTINPRLHRRSPAPSVSTSNSINPTDGRCPLQSSCPHPPPMVLPDGKSTVFIPATPASRWLQMMRLLQSHREDVQIEVLLRMTHRVHLRLTPSTINNGLKTVSAVLNTGRAEMHCHLLYRNVWR